MPYCVASDVKAYLGISGSTDDTLITSMIARTQAAIDHYTGRVFEAEANSTRYFDLTTEFVRGPNLYFDRELAAITTVTNGDGVVVSASEYVTNPRNDAPYYGIRLKSTSNKTWSYTTAWENAISVVGRWAYSVTAPADVMQACVRWAAFMYRQKDAAFQDITAIDSGVAITPVNMPGDVAALLRPYKRAV